MNEKEQLELILKEIKELKQSQKEIDKKVSKISDAIKDIEVDIYGEEEEDDDDDNNFDFEIECPYCENKFSIEADEKVKSVRCPNCNNKIELDWDGDIDDKCSGQCSGCQGCSNNDDDM